MEIFPCCDQILLFFPCYYPLKLDNCIEQSLLFLKSVSGYYSKHIVLNNPFHNSQETMYNVFLQYCLAIWIQFYLVKVLILREIRALRNVILKILLLTYPLFQFMLTLKSYMSSLQMNHNSALLFSISLWLNLASS